jgi:hypothetical protein
MTEAKGGDPMGVIASAIIGGLLGGAAGGASLAAIGAPTNQVFPNRFAARPAALSLMVIARIRP